MLGFLGVVLELRQGIQDLYCKSYGILWKYEPPQFVTGGLRPTPWKRYTGHPFWGFCAKPPRCGAGVIYSFIVYYTTETRPLFKETFRFFVEPRTTCGILECRKPGLPPAGHRAKSLSHLKSLNHLMPLLAISSASSFHQGTEVVFARFTNLLSLPPLSMSMCEQKKKIESF